MGTAHPKAAAQWHLQPHRHWPATPALTGKAPTPQSAASQSPAFPFLTLSAHPCQGCENLQHSLPAVKTLAVPTAKG